MIYLINLSEQRILKDFGDRVPIGLLSIATELQRKGYQTRVYDMNHDTMPELLEEFELDKPEAMGISVYTSPSVPEAKYLAKLFKHRTKLIAGGHHATHMPKSLFPYFDTVVKGEGENNFETAIFKNGIVKSSTPDLTKLLPINYEFLDMSKYNMKIDGQRTGTIITSRGCPYSCAFCGKLEDKVRFSPVKNVITEIDRLKKLNFKSIYFLDDVFTLKQERMKQIVEQVNMPFRVTSRANLINYEKLGILKDNGCTWLSLGIESGSNEILKKANKGMTTQENYEAVRQASNIGIKTKGFFIIGLPSETEHTAKQTIAFSKILKDVGLTSADFYFLTPFPGTPIWNNPDKFDIEITNKDYTKYLEAGKGAKCYVNTKELKAEKIEELVKEAQREWI